MSDPILFFGVLLLCLVALWFFGAFDEQGDTKFEIRLADGSLRFKDDSLEIAFAFEPTEDLSELKHIPIAVANKSASPLKVDWPSCVIVDPDGVARGLVCDLVPKPDAVVAPGSEIDELLIPRDRVGGMISSRRGLLLIDWAGEESFTFKLRLKVTVDGAPKPLELKFKAARVVPAA